MSDFFTKLDSVVPKSELLKKPDYCNEHQLCRLFSTQTVPGQYYFYAVSHPEIIKSDIVITSPS